ncbi:MAG: hypothetical protein KF889_09870 [Alphaproteobacteria bacterium]|nr:hypothetical protein [Alphaproteobacteria bacterium]MCW5741128.1 hypothetical protein [Alphaproteobacteria bacterium]
MRAAAGLLAMAVAAPAAAQGLDGAYAGRLSCEILAGQTRRALATDIRITIAGTTVSYEREIHSPDGGTTGIKERGTGTVRGTSLSMAATGRGNSWSYEASYSGTITGGTIAMRGAQKWHVNRGNQDRQCTINARRR